MDRRQFLSASSMTAVTAALAGSAVAQQTDRPRGRRGDRQRKEFYELRVYQVASEAQHKRLASFLCDVAVPAMTRAEVSPVGVFTVMDKPEDYNIYMLIPHQSLYSVARLTSRLMADEEFMSKGKDFLELSSKDKGYERVDSALLLAFDGVPKVEVPENKPRIFELRCYESHSALAGQKKIEMFNTGGELDIFRETGLRPVFFGEMLVGKNVPNLTYMLVFDDKQDRDAKWKQFVSHPDWKRISNDPKYADTVSKIHQTFLKPLACSQI